MNAQQRRQSRETYFVRVLALVCVIAGIVSFIGGVWLFRPQAPDATIAAMRLRTELGPEHNIAVIASVFRVTAVLSFIAGVLLFLAAWGIHHRRGWARTLTLWLALMFGLWWGFATLSVVMSPWRSSSALGWNLVGALMCAAIAWSLTLPVVKRYFAQPLDMRAQRLRRKRTSRQ